MFFQCYFTRKKLIDYYEGTLPSEKKVSVELHLSKCPSCTGHAYTYRKTRELIAELEDHHHPTDDYWATVWERLRLKLFQKK